MLSVMRGRNSRSATGFMLVHIFSCLVTLNVASCQAVRKRFIDGKMDDIFYVKVLFSLTLIHWHTVAYIMYITCLYGVTRMQHSHRGCKIISALSDVISALIQHVSTLNYMQTGTENCPPTEETI